MQILYNAKIYTIDSNNPIATAIIIENGRVLAVGTDQEILSEFEGRVKPKNIEGKIIIPGLTDAHIHFENYALSLQKLDCEKPTREACLRVVTDHAHNTPPGEWILGHGWNQNEWEEGFGDSALLDTLSPNHPVYLTAKSLHAAWVNSAALQQAGITNQSPDPPDGQLQRDESGNPTGILFEGAMRLVSDAIPKPTQKQVTQAIRAAQKSLWRMGLTGVHDFDRRTCFVALQTLHSHGELRLRVIKSIPIAELPHTISSGLHTGFGDDFLQIGMVKAFADGALGPHTAAMLQPYKDEPDNQGMLLLDAEEILEHGRDAVSNGLGMVIHAIGDRANHEVINAYAQLREFERHQGLPHLRHRIEHVQILHPDDFPRLAELGVIASMQPIHAISDMVTADHFWGERATNAYAWRTLLDQGTTLTFGSDAPVESPNPFWGVHAAVTRRRADGSPGHDGWYPVQKLTRLEAIQAYTTGAAYTAGMEDRLGMLAPGYLADLLVVDNDPFTCEPDVLRYILPTATMVGGKWVDRVSSSW